MKKIKALILNWFYQKVLDPYLYSFLNKYLIYQPIIFGDKARLNISATAIVNNCLFNLTSGSISVGEYAFMGHNVCLLTGSHDFNRFGYDRQIAIPQTGHDIIIETGVWIASNVTVIGPCRIGEHAVIAAGSLVNEDVMPYSIVGGVPANFIKAIDHK